MNGYLMSGKGREDAATSRLNFYEKVVDVLGRMSEFPL
jgi:hypothetical protein